MADTYYPIKTYEVTGSPATTYTFSSIPSTYTDLVLVLQGGDTGSDNQYFRINSDSSAIYSYTTLNGNGTTGTTNRNTNQTAGRFAWYASPNQNLNWNGVIHFMNYANTSVKKTIIGRTNVAGATYNATELTANTWGSTAAITSITLYWGSTDSWAVGTKFSLYGIKAA